MKHKRQMMAKAILNRKNTVIGITVSGFKLYIRAIVISTAWQCHKNRHIDPWKGIDDPNTSPLNQLPDFFYKDIKNIHWRKDYLFDF